MTNDVELECLQAVYAYERAKTAMSHRKFHASRTWQMIQRRGIIAAVEHVVTRSQETMGYRTLVKMGMQEMAFEAVVLRHPDSFSARAVNASQERLRNWVTETDAADRVS